MLDELGVLMHVLPADVLSYVDSLAVNQMDYPNQNVQLDAGGTMMLGNATTRTSSGVLTRARARVFPRSLSSKGVEGTQIVGQTVVVHDGAVKVCANERPHRAK